MSNCNTVRRVALGCAWGLFLAAAQAAAASSFTIAPIRVELGADHRIVALTLHNQDSVPVLIQLRVAAWSQADGVDTYEDTRDLLTTPPLFEVPPQGEQIIRVALRRQVDATRELTYRLFVEEVPRPLAATATGLNMALHLSLPVFVTPPHLQPPQLQWTAHALKDGTLQLQATNPGAAHLQVTDYELQFGADGPSVHVGQSRYALGGSAATWKVTLPQGARTDVPLQIKGFSDLGAFTAQAAVPAP